MNPTLRRSLLVSSSLAFAGTTMIAFTHHAMPWPALLGCFALMGVFMFAAWALLENPRPTMKCLAIWLITVGLCAMLQSMWHQLAGHPQPALPVFTLASIATWSGLALELGVILAARRAGQGRDRVTT
jgi:hypothetical protein